MEFLPYVFSFTTTWLIILASIIYVLYKLGTSSFDYFESQGIPGPKPIPFVGNLWGVWKANLPKYDRELSKKYGKNFGYFDGTSPCLWTTDVDIIKSVFVKDFEHFVNRRDFAPQSKFIRKMLTLMKDQEWKDVRSSVTPAFTSGKIKRMSGMMKECCDRLAKKFEHIARTEGKIEAKKQFSAFTMDVIARCAFGMTLNRLGEDDDPFLEKAKKVFAPPVIKSPIILLPFLAPWLMKLLGERIFGNSLNYFIDILEDLVKKRSESSEAYNDFIAVATETISELTTDMDGAKKPSWTKQEVDEIVIAQSVLFLIAGFDTTGTTLTNMSFLLARHPDVQEKLYEQVKERLEEHQEVTHEMILNFPYLDQVINETLRMYPPATRIERACSKDVTYNGIHIKSGMIVTVPAFGLHYNEDYYPDPDKFLPDRWSADSPIKPNPNAFMPFGMGPRNCIGVRFAMEEMKIALCTLINRFRFSPVAETPEKIEFEDGFVGIIQPKNITVGIE